MELVTKIKEFREKAGLTQADLAEKVGVRRETILVSLSRPHAKNFS